MQKAAIVPTRVGVNRVYVVVRIHVSNCPHACGGEPKLGRKPETINKELGALRRMFNLALQGVLGVRMGRNPVKGLKLVRVTKIKPRILSDQEFQGLYLAASDHFKPILLCAYMTGMRRSEIARLKWKDINFDDGLLEVIETKNYELRTIPIGEPLLNILREMEKRQ